SARAIGLCGVAALAISPLALTLPAQAAAPVTGATAAAPSAAHGGRPDPTYTPADRREAIAEARQDRAAMSDRLRLGAKEALVVKDVLRDTDGTEHIRYNRTYDGLPVIGGDLVVAQRENGKIQVARASRDRITVPSTDATVAGKTAKEDAARRTDLAAGAAR